MVAGKKMCDLDMIPMYTRTYRYKQTDFYVDIIEHGFSNRIDAFLYHKDYGTKVLMFGVDSEYIYYEDFLDMVCCNLDTQDYIKNYKYEVMDVEEES